MELVEAAQIHGLYRERFFYSNGQSDHWTPIEVIAADRRGRTNNVEAIYLETPDRETVNFSFQSEDIVVQKGDVVMKRNYQIAVFWTEGMVGLLFDIVAVNR